MSVTTGMISYPEKSRTSVIPLADKQELVEISIQNESGGASRIALLRRMAKSFWIAGSFTFGIS